jgi:hypothetical protein
MKPLGPTDPVNVGPYHLLSILGDGGMGRVYLGRSPTGRKLAVKVIRPEIASNPVFRRRFAREVAAVRAVSPLYTAPMVDADTEAEPPWLATTFVDGPSLRDWVGDHGPLAPNAVVMLAAGLAEALASIHRSGLVHRDLKPSNVLLDDAGPRIIDFGVAQLPEVTGQLTTSIVGTPSYLAPEQIDGGEATTMSDVFALGATLYFAATGEPLVGQGTMFQQMLKISSGRFDLAQIPRAVRPIVTRCVSRRPGDRPTAEELARILVSAGLPAPVPGWYRQEPAPLPAPPPTLPDRFPGLTNRRLTRRRVLVVGGAVGAAVAAGGAAVVAYGAGGPSRPAAQGPGTVLWLATSGAQRDAPVPDGQISEVPVIIEGGTRLITITGGQLVAVDPHGRRLWSQPLPDNPATQRPWGDGVLVTDHDSVRLFDTATGTPRFAVDLTTAERAAAGTGTAVGIRRVVAAADLAFVDLGTATVAVDRLGHQLWRRSHPAPATGRPSESGPLAADATRVVTQDLVDSTARLSLLDAGTSDQRWFTQYPVDPNHRPPPSPDGDGPPPDGGARRGGPPANDRQKRSEALIAGAYVMLRDGQDLRVVRIADGSTVWHGASPNPVDGIERFGDLLVVAAGDLTGYAAGTGSQRWRLHMGGFRLATTPDGATLVAANRSGVTALDLAGTTRWHTPLPEPLRNASPERVTVHDDTAYVTFRPDPPSPDVLAISLT